MLQGFFAPATHIWLGTAFAGPTEVQKQGWPVIASGQHTLLIAPTGSGKTLAAFLWCIDRLSVDADPDPAASARPPPGVRVLYVSPLKALVYDIERNLQAPLLGIEATARELSRPLTMPRVAVRTGDTTGKERRRQARYPAEILVTTPESLYLVLGSQVAETLRTVDTVIVDEVHALAPTKRGAHLALSLERLAHLTDRDPQRIGLSATARPLAEVARFVGGDRPVSIVDAGEPPRLDLEIVVPAADMTRPDETAVRPPVLAPPVATGRGSHVLPEPPAADPMEPREQARGMWPAIYPHLLALIRSHRSTIVFVNSRALCERLCNQLNELAGHELVRSHHGSLSHAERRVVEELLKSGQLSCIVATSSLELGIDMGAVDLVLLVESPGSAARGLQRVGRAGHGVGRVSKGRLFPKHRGDLLEAAVVARAMSRGELEALSVPQNPLDVLAQQIVAAVAKHPWNAADLARLCRRAANFSDLPDDALVAVLDMLAGRYPSSAFADLEPRIVWDRNTDRLTPRRGAKMVALVNGGTIPDRGLYGVYYGDLRVGELDEEMVQETQAGELFTLGATTWRVDEITRDRVAVSPAPGQAGKLPFWRGDGPGRPAELGRAVGAFVRALDSRLDAGLDRARDRQPHGTSGDELPGAARKATEDWLMAEYCVDPLAARNLVDHVWDQRQATGVVPGDRCVVIERCPDELGDDRVCVLSPFGVRVHAPWALALKARLGAMTGYEVKALWSDDGIVVRMSRTGPDDDSVRGWQLRDAVVPEPDQVRELITGELGASALFAGQFRENASRALLMPRRRPGQRTPLWVQRLKSQELLAVARQYASFPIVLETYRSCMRDVFDIEALEGILSAIRAGEVRVEVVDTPAPSPFARSLLFAYVAAFLYEGDAPLAEHRARALALDRELLRQLLGSDDLRDLLDGEAIAEVEAELQRRAPNRRVGHADALHDLLRRLGDLSRAEIAERAAGDLDVMLSELADTGRAVVAHFGVPPRGRPHHGDERWIASDDAALYRDAAGATLPDGLPAALLGPANNSLEALVERYARTHGPLSPADVAARYGLAPADIEAVLRSLESRGVIARGRFHPGKKDPAEWCHSDVLRRIKRRTLARLRDQVAPVPVAQLGRFLPAWHGVDAGRSAGSSGRPQQRGLSRLQDVIVQLEGLALPFDELEQVILPARVGDFAPSMLDELGAMGWLVWIGVAGTGDRDGKIALLRRSDAAYLLPPTDQAPNPGVPSERIAASHSGPGCPNDLHQAIVAHLNLHGASFFVSIHSACQSLIGQVRSEDVLAALWDLVWSGRVTNDTLQPLRARARQPRSRPSGSATRAGSQTRATAHSAAEPSVAEKSALTASNVAGSTVAQGRRGQRGRSRSARRRPARTAMNAAGGRWSLVSELVVGSPSATEIAHRRAVKLLERHGIAAREAAAIEAMPGGFTAIYPVLRAMEEAGKVRRGYFVDGLSGVQFALPGAVDALRAHSDDRGRALVLSAIDPANPYGWLVPWPVRNNDGNSAHFRRAAGASVVLVGGDAVLYLDRGGRRVSTFRAARDRDRLALAVRALDRVAARKRGKTLRIETIDGRPAGASNCAETFLSAGFYTDPRGLVRELPLFGPG